MAVKSVLVRLKGDNGDLNRALAGSAAASKVLARNLDDADESSRRLSNSLETSNDRTTMLIQGALALGPALVPLGAQAVPVVAGLTAELGAAAAAAGVTALAFWGVGDAVKAVRDYQLQPTEAHLQKMQETLDALGPAGRDFVKYLSDLRPQMQALQDIAQAGMLPGVQDGIESLLTRLPEVQQLIATIATTLGRLSREAGESLGGPEWDAFFDYIQTDAKPLLLDLSHTVGNVVLGFANMMEAFGPISRDFSGGLLEVSRSFATWAAEVDQTQGFQDFVAYIERTGPKVWDTLGALAQALLAVVEAAAPVGEATLPIITALANVIAAIAASPIGPVLIGAAAGFSAIARAIALFEAANGSALFGFLRTGGEAVGRIGTAATRTSGSIRALSADVRAMSTEYARLGRVQSVAMSALSGTTGAAQRTGSRLKVAGTGVASAAALGVVMSGVADKAGLANTATLGLMGTLAGPWGVAAGAAVGATMDLSSAMDAARRYSENLGLAMRQTAGDAAAQAQALEDAKKRLEDYQDDIQTNSVGEFFKNMFDPDVIANFTEDAFGRQTELEKMQDAYAQAERDAAAAVREQTEAAIHATLVTNRYMGAVGSAGIAAGLTTSEINGLVSAMEEQRTAALQAFDAVTQYGQALADARAQAKKSNAGIDANTKAGRENRSALSQLAAAWNNQSDAVRNNTKKFREAKQAFIDTAVAMGVPERKARDLAARLLEIPKQRVINITMTGEDTASAALRRIRQEVLNIPREWQTTYYVNQVNRVNKTPQIMNPTGQADGGVVPKTGLPYADRHLYLLADGERITSNRYGQADRFADVLEAINANRPRQIVKGMLADGGVAGRYMAPPQPSFSRAAAPQVTVSTQQLAGVRIEGRIEMDENGAYLRGVIREEIAAEGRFQRVRAGG